MYKIIIQRHSWVWCVMLVRMHERLKLINFFCFFCFYFFYFKKKNRVLWFDTLFFIFFIFKNASSFSPPISLSPGFFFCFDLCPFLFGSGTRKESLVNFCVMGPSSNYYLCARILYHFLRKKRAKCMFLIHFLLLCWYKRKGKYIFL